MDHRQFQEWLSSIDCLSTAQKQQAQAVLPGEGEPPVLLVQPLQRCADCCVEGLVANLALIALQTPRFTPRNRSLRATMRALAMILGQCLNGFQRSGRLSFGGCIADGLTVRASAKRCGLSVPAAFNWRHRFPGTKDKHPPEPKGIVEADETCVPESSKGDRKPGRKARRRGGKANKRGLSDEQVPILVAVDRSGTTACSVLSSVTAESVQTVLEPGVEGHSILVTDGNNVYPPCAKSPGVKHEALNLSVGERVRDAFHIQTVNSRHSALKDFLRRYRGVSSKYPGNYLRWFERCELLNASPGSCLATAIGA